MGTHAIAWLVKQYRCVLGRMRTHEHCEAHPSLAAGMGIEGSARQRSTSHNRMKVERLEDRVMLSIAGVPAWVEQGPGPITGGQVALPPTNPVTGAISAIAADGANVLYVGTVGGGIWRTGNATATPPTWTAMSDQYPSLAITALAVDPGNSNVVWAGTGRMSSSAMGGKTIGLMKSEDAGQTWRIFDARLGTAGRTVNVVLPTAVAQPGGRVVLVGSEATPFGNAPGQLGGGLLRSTDGGANGGFRKVSGNANDGLDNDGLNGIDDPAENTGLPGGTVTDLKVDPNNANRVYAAVASQGVFRSDDAGLNWVNVSAGMNNLGSAVRIKLAISDANAPNGQSPVYAALITPISDALLLPLVVPPLPATINQITVSGDAPFEVGDVITIDPGTVQAEQFTISRLQRAPGLTQLTLSSAPNLTPPVNNLVNNHAINAPVSVGGKFSQTLAVAASGATQVVVSSSSGFAAGDIVTIWGGADADFNLTVRRAVHSGSGTTTLTLSAPLGAAYNAGASVMATTAGRLRLRRIYRADNLPLVAGAVVPNWAPMQLAETTEQIDFDANFDGFITFANEVIPQTFGVNPGGQGDTNFSIVADPTNANVVFVAGDVQPTISQRDLNGNGNMTDMNVTIGGVATTLDEIYNSAGFITGQGFAARILRGDASAVVNQWQHQVGSSVNSTAPHADSRAMIFANGALLESDDGGISRFNTATNRWESLNGGLGLTEFYSVAYDADANVIIGGAQDVGTSVQVLAGSRAWFTPLLGNGNMAQADGGIVQVGQVAGSADRRFYSTQQLGGFTMEVGGTRTSPALNIAGVAPATSLGVYDSNNLQFIQPYVVNSIASPGAATATRLLFGTNSLYESTNGAGATGASLTLLGARNAANPAPGVAPPAAANIGTVNAMVYGGFAPGLVVQADLILAGSDGSRNNRNQLYIRQPNAGANFNNSVRPVATWRSKVGRPVRSIAIDPNDWRRIFVLDDLGRVWFTANGDRNPAATTGATAWQWTQITANLKTANGAKNLQKVFAFTQPGGAAPTTVLVGGEGGLFRRVGVTGGELWTEYGGGAAEANILPNALVTDIDYNINDDVLLVGTLGRGAWSIANASNTLTTRSTITLSGDPLVIATDDIFEIVRNPTRPWMVDVYQYIVGLPRPASPLESAPLASIESITIAGLGGNDQVLIDSTNGPIWVPGGITVDGGIGTNTLTLQRPPAGSALRHTSNKGPVTGASGTNTVTGRDALFERGAQRITWTNITTPTQSPIALAPANDSVGAGLASLSEGFQGGLADATREQSVAGLNVQSVLAGLSGTQISAIRKRDQALMSTSSIRPEGLAQIDNATSILRRLIEDGIGGFHFDDIASDGLYPTPQDLELALEALDANPANVSVNTTADSATDADADPDTVFDVRISKRLGGIVDLDVAASVLGGAASVDLFGKVELEAKVDLHLVFGVDSDGFFILPSAGDPAIRLSEFDIRGDVSGSGRLGFLGVDLKEATLTVDPGVQVDFSLTDPGTDAADGTIRIPELLPDNFADLIDVDVQGNPGGPDDVRLEGTFGVSAIVPGVEANIPLADFGARLRWANLNDPSTASIEATGAGSEFLDFLEVTSQNVLGGLQDLRGRLDSLASATELPIDIPILQKGLSNVIDVVEAFNERVIDPLTGSGGANADFGTLQDLAATLAAEMGINLDDLDLSYAGGELTYQVELHHTFLSAAGNISVGVGLPAGLDVEASATGTFTGALDLDFTFGIDIAGIAAGGIIVDNVFIKDVTLGATANLNITDLDASARFGFVAIDITNGTVTAPDVAIQLSLNDPDGATNDADGGRINLSELSTGLANLSTFVSGTVSGSATMILPVSVPFLGPQAVGSLTVTVPDFGDPSSATVVTSGPGIDDLLNFNRLNAAGLVGLLGQLTGWLDEFRRSDEFANFDIPLVGPALDQVLGFADAFRDKLLIDDADNGPDDDKTLLFDINAALEDAGLGDKIAAENSGGKIKLVALDAGIVMFTVAGATGLGFNASQASSGLATDVYESVTAALGAPADGKLLADATFTITIQGQAPVEVTVAKSDTDGNGIGPEAFDGAAAVDAAADRLALPGHGLRTGASVIYRNGVGSSVGGLSDGATYFVIKIDDNRLKLAANFANATAATPVALNLTGAGSGAAHSLRHGIGDDQWKLVNAQNGATFDTVQQMVLKLVEVFGSSNLAYDTTTKTLTFTLGIGSVATPEQFGQIDLPINFNLDNLAPLLAIQSNSTIRLMADGSLTLTLGVYLGDGPSSIPLGDQKLADLNGGVDVKTEKVITGTQEVRTVVGQLSGDAHFSVSVNGATAVPVTVTKASTSTNTTLADLVADINAALGATSLAGQIQAVADGQRVVLREMGASVTAFELSASGGDAAVKDIGFAAAQEAVDDAGTLKIRAAKDVQPLVGRLTGNASFDVSLNNVNGGAPLTIAVLAADTAANRYSQDIINDINAQFNRTTHPQWFYQSGTVPVTLEPIFSPRILVGFSGGRLTFTAKGGATTFTISNANAIAENELGIPEVSGNSVDFYINVRDGSRHGITLDGLVDVNDVIEAINSQAMGEVLAAINSAGNGIKLTDLTTTGSAVFSVTSANGSSAAADLGILRADAAEGETPDRVIDGGSIGEMRLSDRFFLQNVNASIGLHLSTPENSAQNDGDANVNDGLNASAQFGFVGISLHGGGAIDATLAMGLRDPGTGVNADGRISLTELIDGLDSLSTIVQAPTLTGGGSIALNVSVTPSVPGLVVNPSAQIVFNVVDLGDVFSGQLPNITLDFPQDLIAFQAPDFNFQNIITALKSLAGFLDDFEAFGFLNEPLPLVNVSVNDLISVADRFATAVADAQANPAGTLQFLEAKLEQAFGLPAGSPLINLVLVDDNNGTSGNTADDFKILKIEISLEASFSESLSVDFNLGNGLSLGGAADLSASGKLTLDLDLGLRVDDPSKIYLFNTTGLAGTLNLSGQNLTFRAAAGPLGVFITGGEATLAGTVPGTVENPGGPFLFTASLDDATFVNNRVLLTDPNFDLGNAFTAAVGADLQVSLPVFFPTDSIRAGTLLFDATIAYNEDTDGFTVTGTPTATKETSPGVVVEVPIPSLFLFDPDQLSILDGLLLGVDGIDLFLEGLQDALDGEVFGFELPLIGDKLAGAADVIGDFRDGFIQDFRDAVESLANPGAAFAAAAGGVNPVSKMLFNLLGPSALNLLLDGPDAGTDISASDIVFVSNISEPGVAPEDLYFDWDFKLGGTLANVGAGIGFDIGIPGLGLETTGAVNLRIDWEMAFGFGLNADDGFYLDIADQSELRIDALVTVPGGGIAGKLGFLQLTAVDDTTDGDGLYTHLAASFGVNIINRSNSTDTKLGFSEMGRIGIVAGLAAEAVVDLGAELSLNSDLVPGAATNFPKIVADFSLIWGIGNFDEVNRNHTYVSLGSLGGGFLEDGLQYVGFENVGLDLGSYFSDLILPIVEKVQEITDPIKPFLDFLTTPIPVISDLAGETTLLDIAALSGSINPGIIAAIEVIDEVVDIAQSMASVPSGNLVLYFDQVLPGGKFTIFDGASAAPGSRPDLTDLNLDLTGLLNNLDWLPAEIQEALVGVADAAREALTKMLPGGGADSGFKLKIIEDPSQIFGMLLGKPAVLVEYDMAALELEAEFSAFFSIFGPLGVSINAEFSVLIDFSFGYDTRGIQDFAASDFRNPALLFNGFFVNDLDAAGKKDVAEVQFNAGLWAAAELNLGIARGGVGGGLFAEINFDLHDSDGDGRVRMSELATNFLNELEYGEPVLAPLAIFDVTGSLVAKLFAFLKIKLGFFKLSKTFELTLPIELLNFNIPFTRVPTLATELEDGVLQLNMGKFAGQRVEGDKVDGNEHFTVVGDGSSLTVTAFGVSQTYKSKTGSWKKVLGLGGEGNDTIDLSGVGGNIGFELEGNAGNDIIKAGVTATGAAKIFGGAGNDQIDGGGGSDTLFGEAGDDVIKGLGGGDWLFGDGSPTDSIQGNVITVGVKLNDGADIIEGGGGNDLIIGAGGVDLLEGGDNDDVVIGDGGTVTVAGAAVTAVKDTDGVKGAGDTVRGNAGVDRLFGGFGNDTVEGGSENDTIFGESGADSIDGGANDDTIDAGTENDVVNAGAGNDTVFGQAGNDVINGDAGDDWIEGGTGFDVIHGGANNDFVFGNTDPDQLFGDAGNDYLEGGGGNDTVEGGDGSDTLVSGYGSDKLDGQADGDSYVITSRGGATTELTEAYDTGASGTDILTVLGTGAGDTFLLRAMADYYFPKLTSIHSILEKIFNSERPNKLDLMKQAVAAAYGPNDVPADMIADLEAAFASGLVAIQQAITDNYVPEAVDINTAFVALLNNGGRNVERFNYRKMEGLVLNTVGGDDLVVFDDVIAATTVNLGVGNDRVQVGQVFNSLRDDNPDTANVADADGFATVAITRGFLSNGVSVATVINGGDGNDEFTVFHNVAALNLNGGDGDDLFTIRAFALAGSTDSERGRTDMKGDGGADTILYVLNAPVGIDGGDGFDIVRIIGTEFADDFVVTDAGVFGAGLNVSYVNIEKLIADGAEGDDRFFVLSTGIEVVTELDGGLGSDSFFVGGNPSRAPIPVISNDFKGHSGVILHSIEAGDPAYLGKAIDGVSANVADNEERFIIVTQSGGGSRVTEGATSGGEGWVFDTYSIRLSKAPAAGTLVKIAVVAAGLAPEDKAKGFADLEFQHPVTGLWVSAQDLPELEFDGINWMTGRQVKFRAISDSASEGTRFTFINHTTSNSTDPLYAEAKLLSVKVQINDDDKAGVLITPSGTGNVVLENGFGDTFEVVLTRQPTSDVTVNLTTANGQLGLSATSLVFTSANWNVPQTATITGNDDAVVEGLHTDYISYTVQSRDVDSPQLQASYLVDGDLDLPGIQPIPADKSTSFLFLQHKPDLTQGMTITLDGTPVAQYTGQDDNVLRYEIVGNTLTFFRNGNAIPVSGSVEASYTVVRAGYNGLVVQDSVVDVYDDDAPDVIIRQSDGSTDVIEGGASSARDSYSVVLSSAPASNVTVRVDAVRTRTTLDGDANFEEQVEVSLDNVNFFSNIDVVFTTDNWDDAVTVYVRAIDDGFQDGSDTQVFAPEAQTVNKIRGPLILEGAAGAGSLSLPAPLLLPGELNIKPSDGTVLSFVSGGGPGATEFMTVGTADLLAKAADLNDLVGKTIELTKGPGTGVVLDPWRPRDLFDRFWLITGFQDLGNGQTRLTLQNPTLVDPALANVTAPTGQTQFAVTALSINFFADEKEQVDYTFVYDNDSVGNESGALTSATGNVVGFGAVDGTTDAMTVETLDLLALGLPANDVGLLIGRTIEITVGAGLGRVWTIADVDDGGVAGTKVLTLTKVSGAGVPTNRSEFRIEGGDTKGRITGFGMGPNVIIGSLVQPGGITYGDMEVLEVNLGSGNDAVRVDYASRSNDHTTKRGGDFYTLTVLNTGAGNDVVNVRLDDGEDGAFALNAQAGDDTVDASGSTLGVVVFGWDGKDNITGGAGQDILFGDRGRVDYINGGGTIITRLGHTPPLNPVNPPVTSANATTLTDGSAAFEPGSLVGLVAQAISNLGRVQFRTIIANTTTTFTVSAPWDDIPDSTYFYRVATQPEDQTDGTVRGPTVVHSVDNAVGGNDVINGGAGDDLIIGGAGLDTVGGDAGNDKLTGDDARFEFIPVTGDDGPTKLVTITTSTVAGDDTLSGGDGDDLIIGGLGNDTAQGGGANDILIGDAARITYAADGTTTAEIETTDRANGGNDRMYGDAGQDLVIGGTGGDALDGGANEDLVLGDNATVVRNPGSADAVAPRYRTLTGNAIYDANGQPLVGGPTSTIPGELPVWSDWTMTLDPTNANFGDDYMAGGGGDDQLFGQLGNDTIQGDGSIDLIVSATSPSVEAITDGDDYVEGNGGNDKIFGNLGQDDLVGGSSNLFSYTTPALRGDGADIIFGGAGTRIARNDPGLAALDGTDNARDADFIIGDNGNIYRLVDASGASRQFNYDNYGLLKLIPRAVQHLDYTYGGNAAADIGAADLLHGEGGDDSVYGTVGDDVLFGGGQDDDIYGGIGHDRIYGGAGEDGILGDDGLILTSRNGMTEPLHNVNAVNAETNVALPGPFTGAWIYIAGRLNKTVDLVAWTSGGNDVIYGGLGDDFLHGGAGDDGISGAEATADFYSTDPVSNTNLLGYDPVTRKLAAYDANNPLAKIAGFFLNFDAADAANQKIEDGKDRLFGDLGNDWLVGGTGNDRLFGGVGDDVHNADDNHETAGGLNNQPDAVLYADRDFVYGGDGLDVLIANTGGDRMYDWGGEFNTFAVPFSPFGEPTVVRRPSPAIVQFIRDLGMESGADQTRTEPDGELGLFTQSDPQWQANHGGPRDPQPGNSSARRDTQGGPEDDRGTALPLAAGVAPLATLSAAAINSADVTVDKVILAPDPSDPARMALFVGGSNADDVIQVRRGTTASTIRVVINNVDMGEFGSTGLSRIIVYGNAGNDSITINADLGPVTSVVYGGDGNDTLVGGAGNNFLDGGDGNDRLVGSSGLDLLIGGNGVDSAEGNRGDDILVGGDFVESGDLSAAAALMSAWAGSTATYATRVAALKAGVTAGGVVAATGTFEAVYRLDSSTVLDDGASDILNGTLDQDWFMVSIRDSTDKKGNETATMIL